ncbi:hypothetical protein, partial [Commensalibacter intestini]|uniref:hypothetical protein n=1 Tax=Commensalibacter intestini TaxID=479936 RepID=UPI00058AFEFC
QTERLEKQKQRETEKAIEEKLNILGNDFTNRLEENFKRIDGVLQRQSKQTLKRLIRFYTFPLCCLGGVCLILCLVSFIASYYFYTQIQTYRQEVRTLQTSAKLYEQTSKGLNLTHCELPNKTDRVCIEIDPNYQDQIWDKKFKIVKLKSH